MRTNLRQFLLSVTFIAAAAIVAIAADAPHPATPPKMPDQVEAANKERDEAKAQLANLQVQQQQQAVVTEYYKAVAEKNQAILQTVALQQQLEAVTKERDALKAEVEALKKPAAKSEEKK